MLNILPLSISITSSMLNILPLSISITSSMLNTLRPLSISITSSMLPPPPPHPRPQHHQQYAKQAVYVQRTRTQCLSRSYVHRVIKKELRQYTSVCIHASFAPHIICAEVIDDTVELTVFQYLTLLKDLLDTELTAQQTQLRRRCF